MTTAVIVDIIRTPSGKGKPGGALSGVHPAALLAQTLTALVARNGLDTPWSDRRHRRLCRADRRPVAEQSRAPRCSRPASRRACRGTTVDRPVQGQASRRPTSAAQGVIAGAYDIAIACGVGVDEPGCRSGRRGRAATRSSRSARVTPRALANQGIGAELIASRWKLDREALDAYSARSHARSRRDRRKRWLRQRDHRCPAARRRHPTPPMRPCGAANHCRGSLRAEARLLHRGVRRALPRDHLAGHRGKLIAAHRRRLRGAHQERGEGGRARLKSALRASFPHLRGVGSDQLLMLTGGHPGHTEGAARSGLSIDAIDPTSVNEAFGAGPAGPGLRNSRRSGQS